MKKGISKKTGIALFCICAVVLALIIVFHENKLADPADELIKKIIGCGIILGATLVFIRFYDKITVLPIELWDNRRLIWKLSKNDFKTRYAGSFFGMFWAMVQPVVTILLYWFVFEVVFQNRSQMVASGVEAPYVLWLTAGLVPWMYFSEAISNGTTALLEYSYLVKKVVFKISIIPIIKIIAATFIHIFFVGVMVVVYIIYGYAPSLHLLQIIYFSICMFILVLALSYTTCAIAIFFRDIMQIISIFLQVGMWATPILWNIGMLPEKYQVFFKLNPIFYIVNGYRSALFEQSWFWEDFYSTTYFWIVVVVLFGIGSLIFKKLKVHFADIL